MTVPDSAAARVAPQPPRTIGAPVLVTASLIAGYGLLFRVLPAQWVLAAQFVAMLATNGFALWCFVQRAAEAPDEAAGWRHFAAGTGVMIVANVLGLLIGTPSAYRTLLGWGNLALVLIAGLIYARGVLVWPLRREAGGSTLLHGIGSLIFASSLALLFWWFGFWSAGFVGNDAGDPMGLAAVLRQVVSSAMLRTVLLGGVLVFFISEDPRRIRGPLGTLLAAVAVTSVAAVGVAGALRARSLVTMTPWFAFGQAYPIVLALAAWRRVPIEAGEETEPSAGVLPQGIQYLPFLGLGVVMAWEGTVTGTVPPWAVVAFVAIAGLVVYRQVLLYLALKRYNVDLERRVMERTQRLEQLQAVLLRTERLNTMATLGAGLAHDLNNLLTVIRSSAEFIEEDVSGGRAPRSEDVSHLVTASANAARLTARVMNFAREGTGAPAPVDLGAAVAALEDVLRMLLPRSFTLRLRLDAPDRRVLVPPTLLEQVLVNLVSNARDAMPGGGEVTVRVCAVPGAVDERVALEVTDTGHGIARELQARIFDSFVTTKADRGTGIGLASVRALMQSVGGTVSVRSEPGRGATFRLEFTLVERQADRAPTMRPPGG